MNELTYKKAQETGRNYAAVDATIVLPPGSNSDMLQSVINDAASGDVIVCIEDMDFVSTVTIPSEKTITIQSDMTGREIPYTLSSSVSGGWFFYVSGQLLLKDIIINGNNQRAGVIVNGGSASFIMEEGAAITNGLTNQGAGVRVEDGASFQMNGGSISGNTATNQGGGVYIINGSNFHLINGEISGNRATGGGSIAGGVGVRGGSTFIMDGGYITDNYANGYGGGVYLQDPGNRFTMNGGVISDNTAVDQGGGVHVSANNSFIMTEGNISRNRVTAMPGYGGGVIVYNAIFDMSGGIINDNTATYAGGGVFVGETDGSTVEGHGNMVMHGGTVGNNHALAGGGIFVRGIDAIFTFNGGSVINNSADGNNGGGAYVMSGTIAMGQEINTAIGLPILSGNTTTNSGGGVMVYSYRTSGEKGIFTMYDGLVSSNSAASGGGVAIYSGSFTMYDGVIGGENAGQANTASGNGGGIALMSADSHAIIHNGTVLGNEAANNGGGGYVLGTAADKSTLVMNNGAITANEAGNDGGGIYVSNTGIFSMSGGEISANNVPNGDGGGVYVESQGSAHINGGSFIIGNSAPNGDGGGIYTADYVDYSALTEFDYQNITTSDTVVFRVNIASQPYLPPAIAASYTNIRYASTSIMGSNGYLNPINNYDINYIGQPLVVYHVIYNANGGIGSHIGQDVISGGTDTILSLEETDISRNGYSFTGWNTEPNGSGTHYSPGDLITLSSDVTLYAQWEVNLYTVTYVANGGTGSHVDIDIPPGTIYSVLSPDEAGISREGYTFTGWNTELNGGGTPYMPSALITLTGNVTFYAQWTAIEIPSCMPPCCVPCCKPCHVPCCKLHCAPYCALSNNQKRNLTKTFQ